MFVSRSFSRRHDSVIGWMRPVVSVFSSSIFSLWQKDLHSVSHEAPPVLLPSGSSAVNMAISDTLWELS